MENPIPAVSNSVNPDPDQIWAKVYMAWRNGDIKPMVEWLESDESVIDRKARDFFIGLIEGTAKKKVGRKRKYSNSFISTVAIEVYKARLRLEKGDHWEEPLFESYLAEAFEEVAERRKTTVPTIKKIVQSARKDLGLTFERWKASEKNSKYE